MEIINRGVNNYSNGMECIIIYASSLEEAYTYTPDHGILFLNPTAEQGSECGKGRREFFFILGTFSQYLEFCKDQLEAHSTQVAARNLGINNFYGLTDDQWKEFEKAKEDVKNGFVPTFVEFFTKNNK